MDKVNIISINYSESLRSNQLLFNLLCINNASLMNHTMDIALENKGDLYKKVQDLLGYIKNDVDSSKELHTMGINSKLASTIQDFMIDPIKAMIESHNSSYKNLSDILHKLVQGFFETHSDKLVKAFKDDNSHKLVYYIVLKEDTTENRNIFFDFISYYDELGITYRLPLLIKFLPERVMDKANLKNEIILN